MKSKEAIHMAKAKDDRRYQLILEAALKLFAEKGFYGTSVKEVADECQLPVGSLYTYFKSKEELVNKLYRYWKRSFSESIQKNLAEKEGRSAHRQIFYNLGLFAQKNPLSFLFLEAQHHSSYLDSKSLELEKSINLFAVNFFLNHLHLDLTEEKAQLIISAAFGAMVQVFKSSVANRVELNSTKLKELEKMVWQMSVH